MEKEETDATEPVQEPVIENQSEDKGEAEEGSAAPRKLRKKTNKELGQVSGTETRKTRSKTRPTSKKQSEKDVTNPASSAKSLVQPIPPGIESDDISGPPAVEKPSGEKKTRRPRKPKEHKEPKVDDDADAVESDSNQPKVTRKLSKLFSRASKMSESGNSGIVMQDSTADMKGKAPKKARKSAPKDPLDNPRKARRNRLESKKNKAKAQPIPQSMESMSSDNFKQRNEKTSDEMSDQKLTRRSSEWSDDDEAGGLPRTDSRIQRMTRAVRQLFCCGGGGYESASEENPSQYTM